MYQLNVIIYHKLNALVWQKYAWNRTFLLGLKKIDFGSPGLLCQKMSVAPGAPLSVWEIQDGVQDVRRFRDFPILTVECIHGNFCPLWLYEKEGPGELLKSFD